jgi:hypothetical protein
MLIDLIVWILSPFVTLHPNFTYFRVVTVAANRFVYYLYIFIILIYFFIFFAHHILGISI